MEPVPLPRVVAQHHVGAYRSDGGRHLPPLPQPRLELPVRPAEERDLAGAAQRHRRPALLVLAPGYQPGRVLGRIPRSLGAVGADHMMDATTGRDPLGQRGAGTELDVVGVSSDGQGHARRRDRCGRERQ